MTRLYVPATLPLLARLDADGSLPVGDDAVVAPDESEEAEYAALTAASQTSLALVAGLEPGRRRRVVVVAEVAPDADVLELDQVVAVHADADDLPQRPAPGGGSRPSGVDDPDDLDDLDDLGWYATQEIPHLLAD